MDSTEENNHPEEQISFRRKNKDTNIRSILGFKVTVR